MDFFNRQSDAKRQSRRLYLYFSIVSLTFLNVTAFVVAYVIPNFLIINQDVQFSWVVYAVCLVLVAVYLAFVSIKKWRKLKRSKITLIEALGARFISLASVNILEKRLINVVEEVAIAANMPVPDIFVLAEEESINAFVSGFNSSDASITLTQGCLNYLKRDELQSLVAHEFSHIRNGDMLINMRLIALLQGMLSLKRLGKRILKKLKYNYSGVIISLFVMFIVLSLVHAKLGAIGVVNRVGFAFGPGHLAVIGMLLLLIGGGGYYSNLFLKSMISRERELLADASALEFTRNSDALKRALMKTELARKWAAISGIDLEEVSHMLFVNGFTKGHTKQSRWFGTHPVIMSRILSFVPEFNSAEFLVVEQEMNRSKERIEIEAKQEMDARAGKKNNQESKSILGGLNIPVFDSIPMSDSIIAAELLHQAIPQTLLDAAHNVQHNAQDIVLALFLNGDSSILTGQYKLVKTKLGQEKFLTLKELHIELSSYGNEIRLPLLEIAFASIRKLPQAQIDFLLDMIDAIVHSDGHIDPFEQTLLKMLEAFLHELNSE